MAPRPRVSARPPMYPPPEFPPRKPALFARTPPAVFPVLLGLLGLALALRRGLEDLALPQGPADLVLGAVGTLWGFAVLAYGVKLMRRPGVIADDLRVLPGRSGIAAATVGGMALAAGLAPVAPALAGGLLMLSLVAHGVQAVLLAVVLLRAPPAVRVVNPSLHLSLVGPIVGALAAVALGWTGLAVALFWTTLPVALVIWGLSALQFAREVPPAPLRPMLAIHLAPASLLATVAAHTGQPGLAVVFAGLGCALLAAFVIAARWLTAAGFSALWGALTFPLGAFAGALLTVGWLWPGIVVLIAAAGVIPAIAWRVLKMWADGSLAARTNAAEA